LDTVQTEVIDVLLVALTVAARAATAAREDWRMAVQVQGLDLPKKNVRKRVCFGGGYMCIILD